MAPRKGSRMSQRARRVDAHHGSAATGVFVYGCNGHVNKKFKQSLFLIPENLFWSCKKSIKSYLINFNLCTKIKIHLI